MSEKVKGVFVRLPLNEEQVLSVLDSYTGDKESTNACMQKTILDLGTPVTGGDVPVAAYTSQHDIDRVRKGKSGDIYGAKNWEGSDEEVFNIPLIRQSDAQAQMAALEAEVVRLRHYLERIDRLIMGNGDPVMMFCGIHASCTEGLKGGAA